MHLPLSIALLFATLLVMAGSLRASEAADDVVGLSLDQVIALLGEEPVGKVQTPHQTIVYFRLGEIRLRDGVVERADLITPEQLAAREALAERHRAEALERVERLRIIRIEEGEELRKQRLEIAEAAAIRASREADFARQEAARASAARTQWWVSNYHRPAVIVIPQSRNPIRVIHHNPTPCPQLQPTLKTNFMRSLSASRVTVNAF